MIMILHLFVDKGAWHSQIKGRGSAQFLSRRSHKGTHRAHVSTLQVIDRPFSVYSTEYTSIIHSCYLRGRLSGYGGYLSMYDLVGAVGHVSRSMVGDLSSGLLTFRSGAVPLGLL